MARILFCAWVMLLMYVPPALAATPELVSAREFVLHLYDGYLEKNDAPNPLGSSGDRLFESGLLKLIRADQAAAAGEAGLLDHDPICSCQDYEALTDISVHVMRGKKGKFEAAVTFMNAGAPVSLRYELVARTTGWRIYDIRESNNGSLRQYLARGLSQKISR